jgi:hypothetical protein
MSSINIPSAVIPVGLSAFEIDTPTRANGATLTLTRFSWPVGPLFTWRVYERERNGVLQLLASGDESGGEGFYKDGTPGAPLTIGLRWPVDKDKDRIRVEVDALSPFTAGVKVEWL